jgi:ribose transport system permease protein
MNRLLGILVLVAVLYGTMITVNPDSASLYTQQDLAKRVGFYGVLTLGVGLLIITGGIDLSIGSVVGLSAVGFGLLIKMGLPPLLAMPIVMAGGLLIGLFHGLLVTKLGLQPFLVTLCGLFAYRGLTRQLANTPVGVSDFSPENKEAFNQIRSLLMDPDRFFGIPGQFLLLLALAAVTAVVVHGSVYGRYLFAIGHNEQAARYAGIPTDRYKIFAYMWCSALAGGLGGILELFEVRSAQPSNVGQLYELYAITGAVLGGCSLRGGEGNVIGIVLGTSVLPLLRNLNTYSGISSEAEYTIIGIALLLGTIADEVLKRRGNRRIRR